MLRQWLKAARGNMAKVSRKIRSSFRRDVVRWRDDTREKLTAECLDYGNEVLRYYRSVVANWRGKPRFDVRVSVNANLISVAVLPTGTYANRWKWIDEGTGQYVPGGEPYVIQPKGDYPLRFQSGYSAKTAPGGRANFGSGQAFGDWKSSYLVIHPGIRPREFGDTFVKNARPTFQQRIEKVFRSSRI